MKKFDESVLTDSLWVLGERDKQFGHSNIYHGNFIPQIPRQFIERFTEEDDVIIDTFLGSGTTLIECREKKRYGIGIELQEKVAEMATHIILGNNNGFLDKNKDTLSALHLKILCGDSTSLEMKNAVEEQLHIWNKQIKLLLLHPPYFDIIKFSENKNDLSNAENLDIFNSLLGKIVDNYLPFMEKNAHIVLVIADKYAERQWIPLGFYAMQEILKRKELIIKATIIKNMSGNRAKINQEALWRHRALRGGFYIFKHEYIFLFKKTT